MRIIVCGGVPFLPLDKGRSIGGPCLGILKARVLVYMVQR